MPDSITNQVFIDADAAVRALVSEAGEAPAWRFLLDALLVYAPNGIEPLPDCIDISEMADEDFFDA